VITSGIKGAPVGLGEDTVMFLPLVAGQEALLELSHPGRLERVEER
jgi:hypothetical protein